MNFCITHYVLYCSLFFISFPGAYPLPLEYLFSSSLFAIQTKRRSKRPRTSEVIIDF